MSRLSTQISVVAVVPLINAGHTGGELVYKYGAAMAHLSPEHKTAIQSGKILEPPEKGEHENDHDKDD